jgi:hypothetical protein
MYVTSRDLGANVNVLTSAGAANGRDEAEIQAGRSGDGEGGGDAVTEKVGAEEMRDAVKAIDTIRKVATYGIPIALLAYAFLGSGE